MNATNYNWQMIGAIPSIDTQTSPIISYSNPGTYQIQLIASNGANSDTIIQSITIYPLPDINAGTDVGVCYGNNITLNATSTLANLSYNWQPSSSLSAPTQSQTITSPSVTTIYVLTVSDGLCSNFDTLVVNVWPLPTVPTITQIGNTLQASGAYPSYQWYFNNVLISGANDDTLNALVSGDYTVNALDTNGCISANSQTYTFLSVGMNDNLNSKINIFPNPVKAILKVAIQKNMGVTIVQIIDMNGNVVQLESMQTSQQEFNIEHLSSGIYLIKIITDQHVANYKLIKN